MNNNKYTELKEQYYNTLNKLNDALFKKDINRINTLRDKLNKQISSLLDVMNKNELV
jgi:hypothetical protein